VKIMRIDHVQIAMPRGVIAMTSPELSP